MRREIHRLEDWISNNRDITRNINFDIKASQVLCHKCSFTMKVQKKILRNIATLKHGHFSTYELVLVCPNGCKYPKGALVTARAEMVNNLVPIGSNYGYDIEVFVGIQRSIQHQQRKEIQSALISGYGISISTGEISKLSKRFLSHIESLHKERSEDMKQVFSKDGGYPLHIDATTEDGKGTLLVIYAV